MKTGRQKFKAAIVAASVAAQVVAATASATPAILRTVAGVNPRATLNPKVSGLNPVGPNAVEKPSGGSTIEITPLSIRRWLLEGSNSVLTGLNGVYQAKEAVNVARGNILPSINLSAAVSSVSSFGLTSVSVLLPFLLPSNWFNLDASQEQLSAAGTGFYLAELNSYASAYALYITILSDSDTLEIAKRQAEIAQEIEDVTAAQTQFGNASAGDLSLAASQSKAAKANVLHLSELLVAEKSAFRVMLSLPPGDMVFVRNHQSPLPQESWSTQQVLDATFRKSPEARQVVSLIAAAKSGEWSSTFSFLGGASLSAPTDSNGNVAFGSLRESSFSANGQLGFGLPATIRLSNLNTQALRLRLQEVKIEERSTIETTLASIGYAREQVVLNQAAEQDALSAFAEAIGKYRQGQINLITVANSASNVLTAGISRVAAVGDLDNRRLALKRILMSDEFAPIPKCDIPAENAGDPDIVAWFNSLFDGEGNRINVDQYCHMKGPKKAVRK